MKMSEIPYLLLCVIYLLGGVLIGIIEVIWGTPKNAIIRIIIMVSMFAFALMWLIIYYLDLIVKLLISKKRGELRSEK